MTSSAPRLVLVEDEGCCDSSINLVTSALKTGIPIVTRSGIYHSSRLMARDKDLMNCY